MSGKQAVIVTGASSGRSQRVRHWRRSACFPLIGLCLTPRPFITWVVALPKFCCHAGIGLGIALKYLQEGHDVLLVGRSLDRLKGAIPKDFKGTGRSLFLAKDVSTVRPLHPWFNCQDALQISRVCRV